MQGRDGLMLWVLCSLMKTLMLCRSFTDLSLTGVIKLQNDDPDNTEREHLSFSSVLFYLGREKLL